MRVYKVIGSVTLNRCHAGYAGCRLLATEPVDGELYGAEADENRDMVVVWDDLGGGVGAMIAVSDGAEAAQPFRPELKAVDAYCAAILDAISVDPEIAKQLNAP